MNPQHILAWALARFDHVLWLNNNGLSYPGTPFPNRLLAGVRRVVNLSGPDALARLAEDRQRSAGHSGWLAGYLGYDLKNQLEALHSRHPNRMGWPDAYFWEPLWVIDFLEDGNVAIRQGDAETGTLEQLRSELAVAPALRFEPKNATVPAQPAPIQARVSEAEYLNVARQLQEHIRAGDIYEVNYCVEFFAENVALDPLTTYRRLCDVSPMPFSALLRIGERYSMGASPERFLRKDGRRLLSQPIKGTAPRGQTPDEDVALRAALRNSSKEQAENLMIVDLVRNDLARAAETGSVQVDELFSIYTFRAVHQMISSVSATLRDGLTGVDALRSAFPMGSMTGAPKIRAMQLIDQYEAARRGLYSGAIGFFTPDGDFDFNVAIRSLEYDATQRYARYVVGSALTHDADPTAEWAECLLKAETLRSVLENAT